jgi:hypothetical protein
MPSIAMTMNRATMPALRATLTTTWANEKDRKSSIAPDLAAGADRGVYSNPLNFYT